MEQQTRIRTQPHFVLPESAALRPEWLHLRSSYRPATHQPAFAPSRISLSLKALHSALRAPFAQQLSPSNEKARIRTQPHFALQESAALRPSGSICAAQLLLSRLHLVQQAAFGACSGSMPPGCAASLRYMPLTRYECFGRPHNPVHYFSSELRFSWHGNSPHSLPVAFMQQACIRTQLHLALPESAALRPSGYICGAANASNAPASIRTQPHFALQ